MDDVVHNHSSAHGKYITRTEGGVRFTRMILLALFRMGISDFIVDNPHRGRGKICMIIFGTC